jgi:hypothetical protein
VLLHVRAVPSSIHGLQSGHETEDFSGISQSYPPMLKEYLKEVRFALFGVFSNLFIDTLSIKLQRELYSKSACKFSRNDNKECCDKNSVSKLKIEAIICVWTDRKIQQPKW